MDGCNVLSETQSVWTHLHIDTTQVQYVGVPFPNVAAGEEPEADIKPPLGTPLQIFSSRISPELHYTKGYLHKTAMVQNQSFHLLAEPPKDIEPHLPASQLYSWQLGSSKWSLHTTNSLDPIVVTVLLVNIPGDGL